MKKLSLALATSALALFGGASAALALPTTADVIVIMDESGSMSTEQAFIGGAINSIEAGLLTAGLSGNRYGNVGFGASAGTAGADMVRKINVGGGDFGTAAEFNTSTASYVTNGSTEDGWAGINLATTQYTLRAGAARNFILVSDEDRDDTNAALTFASILSSLTTEAILLNAIVDVRFSCSDGSAALGIASGGRGFKADGAGGFTGCSGATATGGDAGAITSYVNLALSSGGAAWDLNFLRAGGLQATSFSNAFINVKIQEISTSSGGAVPEPATIGLMGLGLLGLSYARRRKMA